MYIDVYVTTYDVDCVRVCVLPLVISVWACEDAEGGLCGGQGDFPRSTWRSGLHASTGSH